jgi:outer membrane receptor for ferrienterochelin and colicin
VPVLKQLSLEQLMNLEVTSVAKKEQKVGMTAAAIHVITQEDIRRSGVTSIPEALRLAPGVEVISAEREASVDARRTTRGLDVDFEGCEDSVARRT